mmetsp:Transcript_81579/g.243249  ORF Transcript_81579/g.243249 Transcript_81579/m.243249 type:complete len:163 (+) Transcript_81579:82-570(+)
MKQAVAVAFALFLPSVAFRDAHKPHSHGAGYWHKASERAKHVSFRAKAAPENPPVNETNMLAQQTVTFFVQEDCVGKSATFNATGNEFMAEFSHFARNAWSVRQCGKGTFFYYGSTDMDLLSLLGHFTRCGEEVTKSLEDCECHNMRPEVRKLVQSFSLQYC